MLQGQGWNKVLALALSALMVAAPAFAEAVAGRCGTGANHHICVGEMRVPRDKMQLFQNASTQAIDAIASQGFRDDLAAFIATLSPGDAYAPAWTNRDPDAIVAGLLAGVNGVEIETYGGLWARIIVGWPWRNVAKEGRPGEAIRLNLYALGSSAQVAQSIGHEAAHRAPLGLRHPSYAHNNDVGYCEPPYVIGQLVQRQIEGASWRPGNTDCHVFRAAP